MFSSTTAQHIYCTSTVQTVQSATELYLQKLQAAATRSAAQQHSAFTVQVLYKLYSLQLNCTYRNYKLLLHVQLHNSTFTVKILYKLCSLQLNCTYSNYTEAAAICSAAQQHSTFTVQILYKLYILQLNCIYNNYTKAAAKCSAAQQHNTFTVQILYKLYCL